MKSLNSLIAVVTLIGAVAMTASAQVPDLMYLQFNEGAGTSTADIALPGGLSSSPTLTGFAGWQTASPQLGAAALLLPPAAAPGENCKTGAPFSLSADWTIEFWYFGQDTGTTLRYILGDATSTTPFRLYKTGAANMFFGGTNFTGWTLENAYTPSVWTHIAITYDFTSKVLTVYKDGAFLESNVNGSVGGLNITSALGMSVGGAATSTQFVGGIDDFRIWSSVRSQAQIMSSMNIELMSFSDDVALENIAVNSTTTGCDPLSTTEPVGFTLRNVGLNSITAGTLINASFTIDGGTPVNEAFLTSLTLNSGDAESFNFVATANLSAGGSHTVDVALAYAGDLNPLNDTFQVTANSGGSVLVNSFPWAEDFESHATTINSTNVPAGWTNDPTDGTGTYPDWRNEQATTGSLAGPTVDHTTGTITGWYMYIEDSTGTDLAAINLITPCLDLSSLTTPTLSFWHHSDAIIGSTNDNLLEIDVITYPGGAVTTSVATYASNGPGSDWTNHQLSLAAFSGSTVQLVFRGRNDNGTSFDDDVAIDDILVFEPTPTPGQTPRPGLAVMDIENAKNLNFADVASGLGGPYFTTVTQGSDFSFHFEGEPFQPIAVVYGAINPVSATYPGGIGQFDIGGPGVDMNGLPLNLAVFANAIGWAQAGAPGFPFDALFFTNNGGSLDLDFSMPPFGIPAGTVLTTFQAAVTSSAAPFVYLSNAIEVTLN